MAPPPPATAAPAVSAPQPKGEGFFSGVAKKAKRLFEGGAPSAEAKFDYMPAEDEAEESEASAAGRGGESIQELFERQLASGLWAGGDDSDEGRLLATTRALEACKKEGVDSAHAIFGAQVRKAIEALCALVEALAKSGGTDKADSKAALAAALAVASGPRLKRQVTEAQKRLG